MLRFIESIVLFVPDIDAAAHWYAQVLGCEVRYENPQFAFVRTPEVTLGFHPADNKCPGGVGGTTVYWEVTSIPDAVQFFTERGAKLHRGPVVTSFGAGAAMLVDPFGCTIGLNASTTESTSKLRAAQLPTPGGKSAS